MAEKKETTSKSVKRRTAVQKGEDIMDLEFEVNENKIDLEAELENAKKEKESMNETLIALQKQLNELQNKLNEKEDNNGSQVVIKQNGDLTRTIKVISLLPNVYNLSTQPLGKGKLYQFKSFGDSHMIKFGDMQDILALYLNQFEKGYAVLTNKQDYEDLGIGYIFDEVMSKEKVEKLVKLENQNAVDAILNMEEDMQDKIIGIIANKIADGYSYDYNRIKALEDAGLEINELVDLIQAGKQVTV
jgi:hypothetical protein